VCAKGNTEFATNHKDVRVSGVRLSLGKLEAAGRSEYPEPPKLLLFSADMPGQKGLLTSKAVTAASQSKLPWWMVLCSVHCS
jgi:hypothetical protein